MMNLAALTSFNLVAKHGGIGRASRATRRSKATLSRQVKELEEELGIRLIERTTTSFRLTDEGVDLHARTEGLLGEIGEIGEMLVAGGPNPRGRLRISVPVLFGNTEMGGIAADFSLTYPEVQLDITAEDRLVDLVDERFDLVIRANPRPSEDLVGRRFLKDEIILVAPPGLPPPTADGDAPADIAAVLVTSARVDLPWTVESGDGVRSFTPRPKMRVSSSLMAMEAVRGGAGAAILPAMIIAEDIAAGRMISWGKVCNGEIDLWALHLSHRLISTKTSVFINFLCARYPRQVLPSRPSRPYIARLENGA